MAEKRGFGPHPGAELQTHANSFESLGSTENGFRVTSVDTLLSGTQWESEIEQTIVPELQHFARAGIGAVVGSFYRGLPDDYIQGLFGTQLFEIDPEKNSLDTLRESRLVTAGSPKLFDRGTALLFALQAASDLQRSSETLVEGLEYSLYRLPLLSEDAEANSTLLARTFDQDESFVPESIRLLYGKQRGTSDLVIPPIVTLSIPSRIKKVDEIQRTAITYFTYYANQLDRTIEVQAHAGIINDRILPPSAPDPNFAAAKAFTTITRRGLKKS